VRGLLPRLKKVWADGGYAGQLVQWVKSSFGWVLEIVSRPAEACGFQVLPRRWVVERTFGWFNRYRRLSKDYEFLTDTSETMIYIAMIHLMLKRLRPCQAARRKHPLLKHALSFCRGWERRKTSIVAYGITCVPFARMFLGVL